MLISITSALTSDNSCLLRNLSPICVTLSPSEICACKDDTVIVHLPGAAVLRAEDWGEGRGTQVFLFVLWTNLSPARLWAQTRGELPVIHHHGNTSRSSIRERLLSECSYSTIIIGINRMDVMCKHNFSLAKDLTGLCTCFVFST